MKKSNYSIDFVSNTVTVTKKFAEAASQIGTPEFHTMMQLREMNLTVVTKAPVKKKNTQLTYKKMQKYISCLEDAEKYQEEFKVVCEEAKALPSAYHYVASWFDKTFPNYGKLPERNTSLKVINTPADYDKEEPAA
jgi:hypothetical protein